MRFENRNTSDRPEIEFTADVRARELHFDAVPNPEVRFPGHPEHESDWCSERENLPDEVQEGVVYRNARVRLLIASEIVDSDPDLLNSSGEERVGTNLEYRENEGSKSEKLRAKSKEEK